MFAGILLCSVAVLMQEILLTRIFSFTIWYHLAYLTISTALLGFGAAGSLLAIRPSLFERRPGEFASLCSVGAGLALLVGIAILGPRPISPDELIAAPGRFFVGLLGYYAVVTVPFFLAGLAVSATLSAFPAEVNRLYAFDLLGAGLGCACAVLALRLLDGPTALVVCAALFVAAGSAYTEAAKRRGALALVAGLLAATAPFSSEWIELLPSETKSLGEALRKPGTTTHHSEWSPVNRVDLYAGANQRGGFWTAYGRTKPFPGVPPPSLSVVYDAHNGSDVYQVRSRKSLAFLDDHILGTPYLLYDAPRVLVIGVGGGIDVLNAVYRGAEKVTGVELQPITVGLHHGRLSRWTGGWFQRPQVELVAAEGRHYVRGSDETYDILQITAVDTFSAQSTGAYVLAESYLYTVEAFADYFDHLSDDGVLSIMTGDMLYRDPDVPPPFSTRMALVAREMLRRRGVEDPGRHILLIAYGVPDFNAPESQFAIGAWIQSLMVKKTPFSEAEIERVLAFAESNRFHVRISPDPEHGSEAVERLVHATDAELPALLDAQVFTLAPIVDDRPFFFHVLPWDQIALDRRVNWSNPGSGTGQIVLLMMLGQAILLGGLLIAAPLLRRGAGGLSVGSTAGFLLYFLGLGLGFLMIEISFVQKYVLLLGYPTYSLSVTVFSLLIFAALGAALSRRGWVRPRRFLTGLLCVTVALVVLEVSALPWIRASFLAAPMAVRIAVTALLQLPLGLVLGMYFPTGLELLRRRAPSLIPWAWAVNGVASVAASVLAVILGMTIGFSGVAFLAAGFYAVGTIALIAVLAREEAA
jgi:hypothetical protein